jgi:hypothetical protein
MQSSPIIQVVFVLIFLSFLVSPLYAAQVERVYFYKTDFSSDPAWDTNNPSRYFWDPALKMYHYQVEGGTGGYSYKTVNLTGESFVLEYDILPVATEDGSAFRFGTSSDAMMDINKGALMLSEFFSQSRLMMGLRTITQNGNLFEVTSEHDSYPGETVTFRDNTTYHVTVTYNRELMTTDMKVIEKQNSSRVWGYYLEIKRELEPMNRLMISSVGDYNTGNSAFGYIDNVELYTLRPIETTIPTSVPTTLPTISTTAPVTTKSTVMATETTRSAETGWVTILAFVVVGVGCALTGLKKRLR